MGLLTLSNENDNGDENDNENDNDNENENDNGNENDLPWAMCFCALPFLCLSFQPATFGSALAADGIVSYLLLTPLPLSTFNSSYPYLLFFS